LAPKSFGVSTMPVPKCHCQTRLAITRAASGLSGRMIARAKTVRGFGVSAGNSTAAPAKPISSSFGPTSRPFFSVFPRFRT
jgi:hypothetical protein